MEMYILKSNKSNYVSKYGEISSSYLEVKRSKFYCYIFNIDSELDAKNIIKKVKKENIKARHVVYVYSLKENILRFDEDGEPKSTATAAIVSFIQKENIKDICIVIVRYFGNILLGTGLLTRTYQNSFKQALNSLNKVVLYEYIDYSFKIDYKDLEKIKFLEGKYKDKINIKQIKYLKQIEIVIKIEKNTFENFLDDIKN